MLSMNVALSHQMIPAMALQLAHKLTVQASRPYLTDFWKPIGPEDFYSQPHVDGYDHHSRASFQILFDSGSFHVSLFTVEIFVYK